jgi:hypothetical protein
VAEDRTPRDSTLSDPVLHVAEEYRAAKRAPRPKETEDSHRRSAEKGEETRTDEVRRDIQQPHIL